MLSPPMMNPVAHLEFSSMSQFPPVHKRTMHAQNDMVTNVEQSFKNFDMILKKNIASNKPHVEPILMRPIEMVNGVPMVTWKEEEVSRMNIMDNLQ
ncbi:hypothetical protein HAX54_032836, partial [Datura stramonium]|nr:hypothetical protein [Datura stramonium]